MSTKQNTHIDQISAQSSWLIHNIWLLDLPMMAKCDTNSVGVRQVRRRWFLRDFVWQSFHNFFACSYYLKFLSSYFFCSPNTTICVFGLLHFYLERSVIVGFQVVCTQHRKKCTHNRIFWYFSLFSLNLMCGLCVLYTFSNIFFSIFFLDVVA